jgi:hypothetical protein
LWFYCKFDPKLVQIITDVLIDIGTKKMGKVFIDALLFFAFETDETLKTFFDNGLFGQSD